MLSRKVGALCTTVTFLTGGMTPAFSEGLSFKDFPYLIYCQSQGVDHAFYFARLRADGVAIYLTPDRQAGMITIDGVGLRVGGEQSGSCADKTLEDLRSSEQAFDLPNSGKTEP